MEMRSTAVAGVKEVAAGTAKIFSEPDKVSTNAVGLITPPSTSLPILPGCSTIIGPPAPEIDGLIKLNALSRAGFAISEVACVSPLGRGRGDGGA